MGDPEAMRYLGADPLSREETLAQDALPARPVEPCSATAIGRSSGARTGASSARSASPTSSATSIPRSRAFPKWAGSSPATSAARAMRPKPALAALAWADEALEADRDRRDHRPGQRALDPGRREMRVRRETEPATYRGEPILLFRRRSEAGSRSPPLARGERQTRAVRQTRACSSDLTAAHTLADRAARRARPLSSLWLLSAGAGRRCVGARRPIRPARKPRRQSKQGKRNKTELHVNLPGSDSNGPR